jgi:hypothetical protein
MPTEILRLLKAPGDLQKQLRQQANTRTLQATPKAKSGEMHLGAGACYGRILRH